MEIRLAEEVGKMPNLSMDYLAGRENAKELFEQKIAGQMLSSDEAVRKVVLNCRGIPSAASSFIDELLFIDIFSLNYRHGNSVLLLTDLSDELYFNVRLSVEGKKNLIEYAKKNGTYFLTIDQAVHENSSPGLHQTGSPYLLCRHQEITEVLGFQEGEKQKLLVERIVQRGERITASMLAEQENITKTAANNRLNRLYERRLVFRKLITDNSAEKYEYFFA